MFEGLFKIWKWAVSEEGRSTTHSWEAAINGEPVNRVQAERDRINALRAEYGLPPIEVKTAPRNASASITGSPNTNRNYSESTRSVSDNQGNTRNVGVSGLQLSEEQANILKEIGARKPTTGSSKDYLAWKDEYKHTLEKFRFEQEAKEIAYNNFQSEGSMAQPYLQDNLLMPETFIRELTEDEKQQLIINSQKAKEMEKKTIWIIVAALGAAVWYFFIKKK